MVAFDVDVHDTSGGPGRCSGRIVMAMVVFCSLAGLHTPASGQSDAGSGSLALSESGDRLALADEGLTAYKPDGWVRSEPPTGAVLTLRAAGREKVRLEVRVERDLGSDDREQFFSSFHAKLLAAGFRRSSRTDQVTYDDRTGVQTVYDARSGQTPYRLVIWQVSVETSAWMVVGFFPEARWSTYMETFQGFARALQFEPYPKRSTESKSENRSDAGDE
jgi:hypothetical protein